jgi:chromosome partitioning protein
MAKKISILNPKGGCGKTTLSSNLGSSLLLNGYKTLLIDTDPQGTLRDWKSMDENDSQPQIIVIDRPNLQKDLTSIAINFDYLIIDGAAKLQDMITFAVKNSDVVLIPIQPSAADIWACEALIHLIKARQEVTDGIPKAAFIISRQIKNSNLARDIDEALKQFSFPVFKSRTTQRVIYGEALSSGKSVFNIESSGEAASEIQNITKELQNFIYEQKI